MNNNRNKYSNLNNATLGQFLTLMNGEGLRKVRQISPRCRNYIDGNLVLATRVDLARRQDITRQRVLSLFAKQGTALNQKNKNRFMNHIMSTTPNNRHPLIEFTLWKKMLNMFH